MLTVPQFRQAVVSFLRRLDPESELVKRVYATYKWRQTNACQEKELDSVVAWLLRRAHGEKSDIGASDWNLPMETVNPSFAAGLADAVKNLPDREFASPLRHAEGSDRSLSLNTQTDVALFITKGLEGYWTHWRGGLGWDPW